MEDGTVTETLKSALVLDPRIEDRLAGFEPSSEHAPENARKALADHQDRFADDRVALGTLVAQAMAEEAGDTVTVVRLDAGRDDLVYVRDALRQGQESLYSMERFSRYSPLSGGRYPETLSRQPVGAPMERWPMRYRLRHLDLELVNPEKRSMPLEVREAFEPKQPLKTLALDLWSERVTGDGVFPYPLEEVRTAGGTALPHVHRNGDLVVQLFRRWHAPGRPWRSTSASPETSSAGRAVTASGGCPSENGYPMHRASTWRPSPITE